MVARVCVGSSSATSVAHLDSHANRTWKFTGDYDVWVFVNGTLAADLGGVHDRSRRYRPLNASNGTGQVAYGEPPGAATTIDFKLALGSVYEGVVFQADAGVAVRTTC